MVKIISRFITCLILSAFLFPALAATLQSEIIYRVSLGRADDVKLLLDQGASPNQTNDDGVPLLALASLRKDAEGINVVKLLLDKGARINAPDRRGRTALFYAGKQGNLDIVLLLLQNGINYYAIDDHGDIARTVAHRQGHPEIVQAMDDFIRNQTQVIIQQTEEQNKALAEQQHILDEAAKKAAEEREKELQDQAANESAEMQEKLQDLIKKRESKEYTQAMHDLASQTCAFQYWSYVLSINQTTELSPDELLVAIDSHKDQMAIQSKKIMEEYELAQTFIDHIAENAKQRIFGQLDAMPSATYRREQGVGKMDDMKARCELIARTWDQEPDKAQPKLPASTVPVTSNNTSTSDQ